MPGTTEPRRYRLGEPPPQRVALFRALQLGDLLCAVPALRALRAALPAAEITLIGLAWAQAFVRRYPHYLDGFLEFPGYPGLPESPARPERVRDFLNRAHDRRFDLAIQMHGNGVITNPLAVLLNARATAGFFRPGHFCPDPDRFYPYPEDEHEIWRQLRLLDFLGVPPQGEALEFPLFAEDRQALESVAGARGLEPGGYAVLHPGARGVNRRWPPPYFAALADELAAMGLRVVLTGTADEAELTRRLAAAADTHCLDLAGRTQLGSLAALLQNSRLLVCNDTGVSHLAAALRVPSVVVMLQSDRGTSWPPLDRQRHRSLFRVAGVTPPDVVAEIRDLLRKEPPDHYRPDPTPGKEQTPTCVPCVS